MLTSVGSPVNVSDSRQKIREIIEEMENCYREGLLEGMQRAREREQRHADMEILRSRIDRIRQQHSELQQLSSEQISRNADLKQQIAEAEVEGTTSEQLIQEMQMKVKQIQNSSAELETASNAHCNSAQSVEQLENANEELVKKLQSVTLNAQKVQTEITFAKERLDALLKKYAQLKQTDKTVIPLQNKLLAENDKTQRQFQELQEEHALLIQQINDLQEKLLGFQDYKSASPGLKKTHQQYQSAAYASPFLTAEKILKRCLQSSSSANFPLGCRTDPQVQVNSITDFQVPAFNNPQPFVVTPEQLSPDSDSKTSKAAAEPPTSILNKLNRFENCKTEVSNKKKLRFEGEPKLLFDSPDKEKRENDDDKKEKESEYTYYKSSKTQFSSYHQSQSVTGMYEYCAYRRLYMSPQVKKEKPQTSNSLMQNLIIGTSVAAATAGLMLLVKSK